MQRIKIPVVIGKNRLRGNSIGAMVDCDFGDNLQTLRRILRDEALAADVDVTQAWMVDAVSGILRLYEESLAAWQENRDGTVGHIFEAAFPSGQSVLLGDARTLVLIRA